MSDTREKAAWAASDAACYHYPGADQAPLRDAFCNGSGWAAAEIERLRAAMKDACDLLAERTQGSLARSAGHNARLRLESALNQQKTVQEQK